MNRESRFVIVFFAFLSCALYGQQVSLLRTQNLHLFKNSMVSLIQKNPELFAAGLVGLASAAAWKYKLSDIWANIKLGEEVSKAYVRWDNINTSQEHIELKTEDSCSQLVKNYIERSFEEEWKTRKDGFSNGKLFHAAGDYNLPVREAFTEGFVRRLAGNKKLSSCLLQSNWLGKNFTNLIPVNGFAFANQAVINKILVLTQRVLARRELKQLYKDKRYRQTLSDITWSESIASPYFVEKLKEFKRVVQEFRPVSPLLLESP